MAITATTSLHLPTPTMAYGATRRYDVDVVLFEDGFEQRFLKSREQGRTLFYEYTIADSATVADIFAVWDATNGALGCFWATDYQDGTDYLVRFQDNALPLRRGAVNRTVPTFALRVVT